MREYIRSKSKYSVITHVCQRANIFGLRIFVNEFSTKKIRSSTWPNIFALMCTYIRSKLLTYSLLIVFCLFVIYTVSMCFQWVSKSEYIRSFSEYIRSWILDGCAMKRIPSVMVSEYIRSNEHIYSLLNCIMIVCDLVLSVRVKERIYSVIERICMFMKSWWLCL